MNANATLYINREEIIQILNFRHVVEQITSVCIPGYTHPCLHLPE